MAIGAAIAIAHAASCLAIGRSPWPAIALGAINAGQALLAAELIDRWFDRPFVFDDVHHVLGLVAAAAVGAAVCGVGGAAVMALLGTTAPSLLARSVSGAVGIVVVAPLLIALAQLWREQPSKEEWIEGLGMLALLGLASLYTVASSADTWITFSPSALVMPLLLWLTARCRPSFSIAGAFVAAASVLLAVTFGIGRFDDASVAVTERIRGAYAAMTVVTLCTIILTALFTERRRHEVEIEQAEERQRMLVAELDHRVKNVLATVAAVASRTLTASLSAADFAAKLAGRIKSMAATHELISRQEWNAISLRELVQRELAPYMADKNTDLHGPDLTLSSDAGQAVSMVLHELATNAAKHGALSTDKGRVSVRWNRTRDALRIEWHESGGPAVHPPREPGYGTEVICNLVPYELGGTVDLVFALEGLRCAINVPVTDANSSDRDQNEGSR